MVLFQKCVRRFGPSTKMPPTWEIHIKIFLSGTSCSIGYITLILKSQILDTPDLFISCTPIYRIREFVVSIKKYNHEIYLMKILVVIFSWKMYCIVIYRYIILCDLCVLSNVYKCRIIYNTGIYRLSYINVVFIESLLLVMGEVH